MRIAGQRQQAVVRGKVNRQETRIVHPAGRNLGPVMRLPNFEIGAEVVIGCRRGQEKSAGSGKPNTAHPLEWKHQAGSGTPGFPIPDLDLARGIGCRQPMAIR
jgi:hypothetical protein